MVFMLFSVKERYKLGGNLFANYYETVSVILFGIGFTTLFLNKNLIKKFIGLNIMDTSVYLFLTAKGYIKGRVPLMYDSAHNLALYVNPLPSALVLTGIVVSVSITAISLALVLRLYYAYGTLNLDEILILAKEEED